MDFTGITSPTSMFLGSQLYNSISGDLVRAILCGKCRYYIDWKYAYIVGIYIMKTKN